MAMAYYSGLSETLRMTFVQIMILSTIAIVIFLYGMMGVRSNRLCP